MNNKICNYVCNLPFIVTFTEHKDGMLEIVATPVMLVGQNETTSSLVDIKNLNGNLILHSVYSCFIFYYSFYRQNFYF